MKTIRVIIAFLSIYLFVSAVLVLVLFCVWLSRYFPDSSRQEISQIVSSPSQNDKNLSTFTFHTQSKGTNCLLYAVTRESSSPSELRTLFVSDTQSLVINYKGYRLPDSLVPLGYRNMIQLAEVIDADGKTLYSRPTDLIDSFYEAILRRIVTRQDQRLVLVAQDTMKTYTVTISADGVIRYEN